jgi:hypothetical protein
MSEFFSRIAAHKQLTIALGVGSLLMFVGSLLAVPWLVARAPSDFFTREQAPAPRSWSLKILKNLAGLVLVVAGVAMLLLPGQGLLTLIVGLGLLDVPGKHALLVRAARRPSVLRALNYLRRRAEREPFEAPS